MLERVHVGDVTSVQQLLETLPEPDKSIIATVNSHNKKILDEVSAVYTLTRVKSCV